MWASVWPCIRSFRISFCRYVRRFDSSCVSIMAFLLDFQEDLFCTLYANMLPIITTPAAAAVVWVVWVLLHSQHV